MMYEVKVFTGEELDAKIAELAAMLEDEQIDAMAEEYDVIAAMENGIALW
jgi:hypothetical protein